MKGATDVAMMTTRPSPGGGANDRPRRMPLAAGLIAAVGGLALLLAACGGSSGSSMSAATATPAGGAIAGLMPAIRAARLSPTEALRTV